MGSVPYFSQEQEAPAGVEPLEWMVLTTMPVTRFEQAIEKLMWYARRWGIEVLHRTLKSGCRIEQRQLQHADRIEACLAIGLVVAWRKIVQDRHSVDKLRDRIERIEKRLELTS